MLLITQDYAPRPFKRVLSKYYNSFSGYDQQDAHEFLLSMLSGLHEDTNRCDAVVPSSTKTKTKTKVNKNTTMNITKIKDKKNEEEEETTKTTKKDDIKKDDDNENKMKYKKKKMIRPMQLIH
jgi:ubiquitin C-terminal hydrolase